MRGLEEIVAQNEKIVAVLESRQADSVAHMERLYAKLEELQYVVQGLVARVAVLTDNDSKQQDKLTKIEADFIASARRSM